MERLKKYNFSKHLTNRDINILFHLASYGFATRKQLFSLFWSGSPRSCAHHRRIRTLCKLGLIKKIVGDSGELGVRISKLGLKVLKIYQPEAGNLSLFNRAYKSQFEHDTILQQVTQVFDQSPAVIQIETEKQLLSKLYRQSIFKKSRNERLKVPDALLLIETPSGFKWAAIELELTRKSTNRYYNIIQDHLISDKWDLIFYIVKDQSLRDLISKNHQYCKQNNPRVRLKDKVNGLYFVDLKDLQSNKEKAIFESDEDSFTLESLLKKHMKIS